LPYFPQSRKVIAFFGGMTVRNFMYAASFAFVLIAAYFTYLAGLSFHMAGEDNGIGGAAFVLTYMANAQLAILSAAVASILLVGEQSSSTAVLSDFAPPLLPRIDPAGGESRRRARRYGRLRLCDALPAASASVSSITSVGGVMFFSRPQRAPQ
jgi:hypothetical protein